VAVVHSSRVPRDLAWDGCVNVRDLGGFTTPAGTTAFGVFVRGDNARNLTRAGWRAAREYGIRTVLDLRSDPECAADPPAEPNFTHRRLSLFDHFDGDEAYRRDLLTRVADLDVTEKHRTLYREALDLDAGRFAEAVGVLAEADGGVLFHCVGGKDRTGLLAALLLRLVGVPIEAVEADYVRSEARLAEGAPPNDGGAPRNVINQVVDDAEARHGTTAAYFLQAGASPEHLERIRRRFVVERAGRGSGARRR
jgi:protein-tyrosine phosphatase